MARLAVGEKMLDFTAAGAFGPEEALKLSACSCWISLIF